MQKPFLGCILICLLATPPSTQAITLFLDTGDQQSGVQAGPLTGANPSVFVEPGETTVLHLWALPDQDANKVVVSTGFHIVASGPGAANISALQFDFDNPALAGGFRWSGVALKSGLNVDGNLVSDQRAVFIPPHTPHTVGGLGSATASNDPGFDSNSGAIHLGRLVLTIAPGTSLGSTEIPLVVSPLLIANVVATGSATSEPIFFGYDGVAAEPADGDGATDGASSTIADATVVVRRLGDADEDGDVDIIDYDALADCLNGPGMLPLEPESCLVPFDADQDSDVDLDDFAAFLLAFQ